MESKLRTFQHGHGIAIMLLVAEIMGLDPLLATDAKRLLDGEAIHPMTGAAMEKEAVRMNDVLRSDPEKIAQANEHAKMLKVQYGFLAA